MQSIRKEFAATPIPSGGGKGWMLLLAMGFKPETSTSSLLDPERLNSADQLRESAVRNLSDL